MLVCQRTEDKSSAQSHDLATLLATIMRQGVDSLDKHAESLLVGLSSSGSCIWYLNEYATLRVSNVLLLIKTKGRDHRNKDPNTTTALIRDFDL